MMGMYMEYTGNGTDEATRRLFLRDRARQQPRTETSEDVVDVLAREMLQAGASPDEIAAFVASRRPELAPTGEYRETLRVGALGRGPAMTRTPVLRRLRPAEEAARRRELAGTFGMEQMAGTLETMRRRREIETKPKTPYEQEQIRLGEKRIGVTERLGQERIRLGEESALAAERKGLATEKKQRYEKGLAKKKEAIKNWEKFVAGFATRGKEQRKMVAKIEEKEEKKEEKETKREQQAEGMRKSFLQMVETDVAGPLATPDIGALVEHYQTTFPRYWSTMEAIGWTQDRLRQYIENIRKGAAAARKQRRWSWIESLAPGSAETAETAETADTEMGEDQVVRDVLTEMGIK